jgi:predicted metal-binding membrane protein
MEHMTAAAMLPNGQVAWTADVFWWLVMIMAMMFPMVLTPVRNTAARSLWRRRHRAIGGFLLGYLGPWMVFGIAAAAIMSGLRTQTWLQPAAAAGLGFGLAVLWQTTSMKRRALLACHRTLPIAPNGWRADRDCLRYGWMTGISCLVSCWALMLACVLAGHSIPAMLCATAIGWTERNTARPNQRLLCAIIALFALTYVIQPYT